MNVLKFFNRFPFSTIAVGVWYIPLLCFQSSTNAFISQAPITLQSLFILDVRKLKDVHPNQECLLNKQLQRIPKLLHEGSDSNLEGGNMILVDEKNLLNKVFSSLNEKDKYETVLTGLCSNIIDKGTSSAKQGIIDPIRLIEEMNSRGIVAGPRGIISLIDATALTSDATIMGKVLSLAIRNGSLSNFGKQQEIISPIPRTSTSYSFGGSKERQLERLNNLPPVPDDDRTAEVSQAIIFASIIGSCLGLNTFGGLLGLEDFTPWTNLIIGITVTTVVVDNFFDVLVMGGSMIAKMNNEVLTDNAKFIHVPRKEDMPLGLGTGNITGKILRGFSRLLIVNTERDCQCEAAAVFIAYTLGLPCFAFQPNALEGAALVVESTKEGANAEGNINNLASDIGLLKVLIWLLAPVAIETSKYPQLISSDPREALGFLKRLDEIARSNQSTELMDALPDNDSQVDDYLRWAIAEADSLLRNNRKIVETLTEALAGGAATVGDCVAVLEGW